MNIIHSITTIIILENDLLNGVHESDWVGLKACWVNMGEAHRPHLGRYSEEPRRCLSQATKDAEELN